MKLCLDTVGYTSKPDKKETGKISNRIVHSIVDMDNMESLAKQLVYPHGRTFVPAVFANGKRTNDTWVGQSVYGLDFDNGITVDQVLERCKKYNVMPAFIYSTFSSINNNKFRVIFCADQETTDYRLRTVLQIGLMTLFPESDKSCKDSARLYFGGKELLYSDYTARINPVDLVRELCRYINDSDSVNSARNIKAYCQNVGLDMINGLPKILPFGGAYDDSIVDDEGISTKIEEMEGTPIYTILIGSPPKSSKNAFQFFFAKTNDTHKTRPEGKQKKFIVDNEKVEREELIADFNFEELQDKCRLWKEFTTGEHWACHNELFGIATNACIIKGGRGRFIDILKEHEILYETKADAFEYYCNQNNKYNYAPMQCNNFCPFADTCEHTRNMIDQVILRKGQVRILNTPELKTLEQAERELSEVFSSSLAAKDCSIYVIKAPTGIGKSKLYETVKNVTIALPTHKLKEEIAERMITAGNTFTMSPKLPEDEHTERISYLYSVGSYMLANQVIRKLAKEKPEYAEYVKQLKAVDSARGTVLTTHEKLLSMNIGNDTVIIDEDIIPILLPIGTTTLNDLETLVKECNYIDTCTTLESIMNFINKQDNELIQEMPSYGEIITSRLELLVSENRINTNVLGLLRCSHFIKYTKDDKVVISFINRRELKEFKKHIMLSATANEYICKLMFGDRLRFIDIGYVESKGKIEQYPQKSFSRHSMREDEKLKKLARALTKARPTITFKEHAGCFNNCIATYGATAGLDTFSGQDIAVVGTPHVNPLVYLLFANALGKKPRGCNNAKNSMNYIKIRRNGFEFYFQTFNQEDSLQAIQLYLIESELLQAIGRARLLRNDCTVIVLSNLPVQGAEFKYLTKEELEEILKD